MFGNSFSCNERTDKHGMPCVESYESDHFEVGLVFVPLLGIISARLTDVREIGFLSLRISVWL